MAERTTTKTVKSIRIKLKNVRVPQASAAPSETRVQFYKIGMLAPKELKARAKKRKAELVSYVEPSASIDDIVKALLNGDSLKGRALLPRWDSALELPSCSKPVGYHTLAEGCPSKRHHAGTKAPENLDVGCKPLLAKCDTLNSEQTLVAMGPGCKHVEDKQGLRAGVAASCPEKTIQRAVSTCSDHATTSAFASGHVDSRGSRLIQQNAAGAVGQNASILPSASLTASENAEAAQIARNQPTKEVVGTSVQAGSGGIMPLNLLGCSTPGAGMLAEFISSLELSDLRMPVIKPLPTHGVTDSKINLMIRSASDTKRLGDQERRSASAPWRVKSLSKYVEASLMYMETCAYMSRLPRSPETSIRIAALYGQTADLLMYSAKQTELNFRAGAELGKETLRILCERLAAICCMREAAENPSKILDQAQKVKNLIQMHKNQQNGHRQVTPSPPGKHIQAPNCSPDGSTVSSHDLVASNMPLTSHQQRHLQQKQLHTGTAAELGHAQTKLLAAGERVVRYADMVRRSSNSFQEVIERPDVRENHFAKLACVHLAATFMNGGLGNTQQVIAHARAALNYIKAV